MYTVAGEVIVEKTLAERSSMKSHCTQVNVPWFAQSSYQCTIAVDLRDAPRIRVEKMQAPSARNKYFAMFLVALHPSGGDVLRMSFGY